MRLCPALFLTLLLAHPGRAASLAEGDSAFGRIDYSRASDLYASVLTTGSDTTEALWRLARVHIAMSEVSEGKTREVLIRKAAEYARRAVRANPHMAEGHTWLAAALGNLAMYEGSKTKVRLTNEIKAELETAVTLNPDDDVAYSVLGSFYRALGNISWLERQLANVFLGSIPPGGYEESEKALTKAIAIAPTVLRHHFELGLLYLDWDRTEEAKRVLLHCTTLPVQVASDRPTQERVRELLQDLR